MDKNIYISAEMVGLPAKLKSLSFTFEGFEPTWEEVSELLTGFGKHLPKKWGEDDS